MQAIADRLGFDLISLRLELFGRKRDAAAGRETKERQRTPKRAAAGSDNDAAGREVAAMQGRAGR